MQNQPYRSIFAPSPWTRLPKLHRGSSQPRTLSQFGQGLQRQIPALRATKAQFVVRSLMSAR